MEDLFVQSRLDSGHVGRRMEDDAVGVMMSKASFGLRNEYSIKE